MKSTNFEFIRARWDDLASLGGFAEQYIHTDPESALVKLRSFGEIMTGELYRRLGLVPSPQADQYTRLTSDEFVKAVPSVVCDKLHLIRKHGNAAAHGDTIRPATASLVLREAHELARWLYVRLASGAADDIPAYQQPKLPASATALKKEKASLLRRQQEQQAELDRVMAELEKARAEATAARATTEELEAALRRGQEVANTLGFNEEDTRRRLIDTALAEAGWNVGPNGASTSEVGQEIEVPEQPTDTGIGYADYVLWDDNGRPLAVLEAKKTARDWKSGQQQAALYADGLEKKTGHRPIIFYTNGYDISIWNDSEQEPPRRVYGFHSKDSLQRMTRERTQRKPVDKITINSSIVNRAYQHEAIKRITETFAAKKRRALCVQATGTGKTRVAIALCDALIRAGWAKRILFLCDRRELRKQADGAFKQFLPSEPRTYVTSKTYLDRENRIYLATYPAMMKVFATFDVGFFDLIIADESHRSIYNRYRPIFDYFDAYQVGLTATPRDLINKNTYELFACEGTDPTTCFSYEEAINHTPAYLVPYRAESVSFGFIRGGIKYSQMTAEQKAQLDEQDEEAELVEHERPNVDKQIFNRDTNRHIIRNLMEHGIRIKDGTELGKSIIFARNHNHAVLLQELFDELYPQYGGRFCRVIDNYDPRAADLIDNFKDPDNPLTIAVSVDMLDTGIDVPEVVNLVFAKPVYSNVKFHQMIGRGTRLCPDLFGPGDHKKEFLIFDHWDNFDAFGQGITEPDPTPQKSLLQTLYETRLELAAAALNKPDADTFDTTVDLLQQDAISLPDKTIAVRDHWREVQLARTRATIHQFAPTTVTMLRTKVAPLMQWRNPEGGQPAYRFDLLITRMQLALLTGESIEDHRDEALNNLSQLQMNLSPVRAKADAISRANEPAFWTSPTIADLEDIRLQLRGIMRFRLLDKAPTLPPKIIDVAENPADIQRRDVTPQFAGHDEVAYRRRVTEVLQAVIDQSPALQRIRRGEPVTTEDLDAIAALVVAQDPDLDLHDLRNYYPEVADHIDLAIRSIIGLDPEAVNQRFQAFLEKHPGMNATQTAFLRMLQGHIARYGTIEIDRLYEAPFTTIDAGGIDGVFNDEAQIDDILDIIATFRYAEPDDTDRGDSSHTDTTTS